MLIGKIIQCWNVIFNFHKNGWYYRIGNRLIISSLYIKNQIIKKEVKYRNQTLNEVGKKAGKAYLCMFKKPLDGHFLS